MTVHAALPGPKGSLSGTAIISLVVPAPEGCNHYCPGCFIALRSENIPHGNFDADAKNGLLGSYEYYRFIHEVSQKERVAAICVQGYEPLLPEAFAFTELIIEAGNDLNIPTSLVTNGMFLALYAGRLARLKPRKIAVSLDASTAEMHDRQRRRAGAWHMAVGGLKAAVTCLPKSTELTVASILIPKRRAQLENMPETLKEIGVQRWIVTPFQKVGRFGLG
ncbi:MAG: radical SAM protein, partial [Chloroflexota bacterium]